CWGGRLTGGDCARLAEEKIPDSRGIPQFVRPDLLEVMTFHGRVNGWSFGRLLMRNIDRRIDGWFIQFVSAGRTGSYRLVGPDDSTGQGDPSTDAGAGPPEIGRAHV